MLWSKINVFEHLLNLWNLEWTPSRFIGEMFKENICTLSYHHQNGSMNYYPLFTVRAWNNNMRCMSFYILLLCPAYYFWIYFVGEWFNMLSNTFASTKNSLKSYAPSQNYQSLLMWIHLYNLQYSYTLYKTSNKYIYTIHIFFILTPTPNWITNVIILTKIVVTGCT